MRYFLLFVLFLTAHCKLTITPPVGSKLEATAALNVRATPCTNGRLITTIPQGTVVTFNGKSVNACNYIWWEIKGTFGIAWAASNYLRLVTQRNQRINAKGIALVKHFEGLRLCKYQDPGGLWTICYGHLLQHPDRWTCVTEARCSEILVADLNRFDSCINNNVKVPLTSDQHSALVSFAFNMVRKKKIIISFQGCGALQRSTLLKLLNQGEYGKVCGELRKWVNGGGRRLPGLVRRREAECKLFHSQ